MSVCWHCLNFQSDTENRSSPFSQTTALPWWQEHARSVQVCSNRHIFGFTLNLFISIIQHAVAFRAAVQSTTWVIAVLNSSEHAGPECYEHLLCMQKSPVWNNWSVNCCLRETSALQGDGWKEPGQRLPGYFLGKSIMLLFLRHQHSIRLKPPNVKARQAELDARQYFPREVEILVFTMANFWDKAPLCTHILSIPSFSKAKIN